MKKKTLYLLFLIFPLMKSQAQNFLDLIPLPTEIIQNNGTITLHKDCCIITSSETIESAEYLAYKIRSATKFIIPVIVSNYPLNEKKQGDIILFPLLNDEFVPKEGYELFIDSQNVILKSVDCSGMFYGVQTLLQLFPPVIYSGINREEENWILPTLTIKDYPRFGHRGLMLDVSRQFYEVATVKKYLDWMAMLKLNIFHWHLSDDNGWRIEIKAFPKLTEQGGWRGPNEVLPPSYGSGNKRYGGFYTQEDIKDVVTYAQKLHINIIPEIDLPGHGKAATSTYPEILCESNDVSLSVNGENINLWCVGKEQNYTMLDKIMGELAQLFPYHYIHIGGDEVNPNPWKVCPHCQDLMKKEGMKEVMELQSYFVKRMEQIVEKHGKTMIGWDEIIDNWDISNKTAITAWKSISRGINSIKKGHPTVMQPGPFTYLDMKQSSIERGHSWAAIISLERIYSFDPTGSNELTQEESKLLLGVQAGLWGELLDRPHRIAEYQLFPRLCALAEIGWTTQEKREWNDFNLRVNRTHFERMYEMGIYFRIPPPKIDYNNDTIFITPPFPWSIVRYTNNDSNPTSYSPSAPHSISTKEPWKYQFATFYRDKYISPVIAGAPKNYQKPTTTVTFSFPLQGRNRADFLTDYNHETYIRTYKTLNKDDYLIYSFDEPLNCKKITVVTGIPNIELFYVEDGYVSYSLDGINYISVGQLEYGTISFTPPNGVKSVKLTMGDANFSVQNGFCDLFIE